MKPVQFAARIRYWNPDKASGLAVCEIPTEHVVALGGLKQQHVHGLIGGIDFSSSVMPAGGGRLALIVSKAMMAAAGLAVGDPADIEIRSVGHPGTGAPQD